MSKVPHVQPTSTGTAIWGHAALCAGVVISGYLVYRLSGGFPPATWLLLLDASRNFSTLWVQRGPAIFFPFAILVVQALLLAIAWIALIVVAIREALFFLATGSTSSRESQQRLPPVAAHIGNRAHYPGTPSRIHAPDSLSSLSSPLPVASHAGQRTVIEPEEPITSRYKSSVLSPSLFSPSSNGVPISPQAFQSSITQEKTRPLVAQQEVPHILSNPFDESDTPVSAPNPASSYSTTLKNPFDDMDVEDMVPHTSTLQIEELFNPFEPEAEEIPRQPASSASNLIHPIEDTTFPTAPGLSNKPISSQQMAQINPFEEEIHADSGNAQFYELVDDKEPQELPVEATHTKPAYKAESPAPAKSDDMAESFLYLLMGEKTKGSDEQNSQKVSTEPRIPVAAIEQEKGNEASASKTITQPISASPPARMLHTHVITHPGIRRAQKPNEDSYMMLTATRQSPHLPPLLASLFLVADGMGGHEDGGFASKFVVEAIRADMEPLLHSSQPQSDDFKVALLNSIKRANTQLFQRNQEIHAFRGTTLTGAVVLEQSSLPYDEQDAPFIAHVINVGDSRTYLYSQTSGFSRVTRDHSIVETLIERKMMTPEERYTDGRRSEIYRCLGEKPQLDIDVFSLRLQKRDRLLFCSDGLWEMVRDPALGSMLSLPIKDPAMIASLLLQAALEGGGDDNVTAIVALLPDE